MPISSGFGIRQNRLQMGLESMLSHNQQTDTYAISGGSDEQTDLDPVQLPASGLDVEVDLAEKIFL